MKPQPAHSGFDLSPERRALLAALLEERGIQAPVTAPVAPRRPGGEIPLSFGQQRLWFLDQLAPGHPFYTIAGALRLPIAVSAPVLERALSEIVRRHEALRTTFPTGPDGPVQAIGPPAPVTLERDDLRDLPAHEREPAATRLASAEAQRPFDLATGPLLRARLLTLTDTDHVLLLGVHHIVADGWSMTLLVRELSTLYTAFAQGRPSPLPELTIQYPDYAVWQRTQLQGDTLQGLLDYWSAQLKDLPVLALPTDHPRPPIQAFRGASQPLTLPAPLTTQLRALGQHEGATLFMTLLAGFAALLHRYTDQDDLPIGAPIAGRTRPETEPLIGFFVNTLVLRTNTHGNPSFRELIQRTRATALDAYAHQDLPFETLVEHLQPHRDLSRNPLFQVTFQVLNVPGAPGPAAPSGGGAVQAERTAAIVDLALNLMEGPDGVTGHVEYDADMFEEATVARMAAHYRTLLHSLAADPDRPISQAPMLGADERRVLLEGGNATDAPYPAHLCCHHLFEAQAERTPEATAIVQGDTRLSYRELDRRASRLASQMRTIGVGRGSLVGLFAPSSAELVAGLLAVLKAGAAYVPMDTSWPRDRLAFVLADTRAPVVLTTRAVAHLLPAGDAAVICMDAHAEAAPGAAEDLPSDVTPDDLAYVIYTSGSTGTPKGVMIEHRGVVNYLTWCVAAYDVAGGDGAPVTSSIAFDLAVTAVLSPLVAGRSVHLMPDGDDVDAVASALRRHGGFSLVKTTPAQLELLAGQLAPGDVDGTARVLVIGGEALTSEHLAFWRRHAPETRLINEYGPTETVVGCCAYEVPHDAPHEGAVPIGRPIANTRVYVVDRHGQPVPAGVPGELLVGGDGVGRGYLNQPELTAERFIPDPYSTRPGARLYKTGDIVRHRADGQLEYLGRRDDQVKLRGHRIELGEVEAVLRRHPDVRDAAVVVQDRPGVGRQLAACVVARREPPPSAGELRRFLARALPAAMLPATFADLDALPVTAGGKVDRRALALQVEAEPARAGSDAAPRTATEAAVAREWQELLAVPRIGVHDNFFELGGHSLLATQLMSRLRDKLQVELPVRALFDAPTVADLAVAVEQAQRGHGVPADVPIPRLDRTGADDAPTQVDRLSDAEIEAMLEHAYLAEELATSTDGHEGAT